MEHTFKLSKYTSKSQSNRFIDRTIIIIKINRCKNGWYSKILQCNEKFRFCNR